MTGSEPQASAGLADLDAYHTGVNVGHFTGGPCAEVVALGVAATAGSGPIAEMAAVGNGGRGVLAPCGRCRQFLVDQHPDCRVIIPGAPGCREHPSDSDRLASLCSRW